MFMKELIDLTIDSLVKDSYNWTFSEYTADNTKTKISIWVGNGILSYCFYKPCKLTIGLVDQLKIHRAIRKCKANILINKLNETVQE